MKRIVLILLALMMVALAGVALAETVTVEPGATLTLPVSFSAASGSAAVVGINTNDAPVTFADAVGAVGDSVNDAVPPKAVNDFFVVVNLNGLNLNAKGTAFSGDAGTYTVGSLVPGNVGTVTFTVDADATGGPYTVEAYAKSGSVTVVGSVTFTIKADEGGGETGGETDRLPGDVNNDKSIDILDLAVIEMYFEGYPITLNEQNADVNGDTFVDILDLAIFEMYFEGYPIVFE